MPTFDPNSREAEANAEIAATRIRPGVTTLLVAGFVATLLAGPLLEAGAIARGASRIAAPMPPAEGSLLARANVWIQEIERRFDERSALVELVRPPAQRFLVRFAVQGNERTMVGRDGWLFFADDVAHLATRAPASSFSGDPEGAIVAFRDALAERGITLLLVPVPGKAAIHPERLGALRRVVLEPPLRREGEAAQFRRLAERGVEILDLAPRFARDASFSPDSPLYLATDTHWRPEGVEIAAGEIALRLREIADLPPGETTAPPETDIAATRTIEGTGDLVALLGVDPRAFPRERVETTVSAAPSAGGRAPVLLLGDSFAAIYSAPELGWGAGAGLAERLAARLGLPVDRIVQNAGGASATRERLARELAADPARLDGVRAVVWLFAAREWSHGAWREVELAP